MFSRRRIAPVIAYLIMAAAVLYANIEVSVNADRNDARELVSARAGCERTNELRIQLNKQTRALLSQNEITTKLFADVAANTPPSPFKERINATVEKSKAAAHDFKDLNIIDCTKVNPSDPGR